MLGLPAPLLNYNRTATASTQTLPIKLLCLFLWRGQTRSTDKLVYIVVYAAFAVYAAYSIGKCIIHEHFLCEFENLHNCLLLIRKLSK